MSERTRVKRIPKRGHYDRETIDAILDEAFICHVGFVVDGQPYVIPTAFGRVGDTLYIHGSSASRMLRELSKGVEACLTVTHVDGLVLARSAFHHSINYRSVVVLGRARPVDEDAEKIDALRVITEHIVPGRWAEVRWPSEIELKATSVLSMQIDEASAKVRSGPPVDDDDDLALRVWAGVLPLAIGTGEPIADEFTDPAAAAPEYVANYRRPR